MEPEFTLTCQGFTLQLTADTLDAIARGDSVDKSVDRPLTACAYGHIRHLWAYQKPGDWVTRTDHRRGVVEQIQGPGGDEAFFKWDEMKVLPFAVMREEHVCRCPGLHLHPTLECILGDPDFVFLPYLCVYDKYLITFTDEFGHALSLFREQIAHH